MNPPARRLLSSVLACLLASSVGAPLLRAAPPAAYPQPDPSAEEQTLLELINRARANPPVEGIMLATLTSADVLNNYVFFKVNTAALASDFAGYAAVPPLALNPDLMASARAHSLDMAASGIQQHDGTDGSTFDGRISATGYQWGVVGENVYDWVDTPFFAHAGFTVDWGVPSLDHRANIMGLIPNVPDFREVGISYVATALPGFGPNVVTEDFATPADGGVAYVLGVVYADANHNASYDQGEGLAGVTISTDSGAFYAVTATAGGFVLPLPPTGAGTLTLVASGGPLGGPRTKTVAWTAGTNVKVDFTTADPVGGPIPPVVLPTVSLSVPAANAKSGTGLKGVVTISRAGGDAGAALWVPLVYGGTAVSGVDYAPLPEHVIIPAGQASVDVSVRARGGSDERRTLLVRAAHRPGYTVSNGFVWSKVNILIPRR